MWKILSLSIIVVYLSSCSSSLNTEYEIPKDVVYYGDNIISPYFIEQLTEDPLQEIPAWNDSLIELLQINQVLIKSQGIDNLDNIGEEFKFNFRRQGFIYSYLHTNSTVKPTMVTEILYNSNGALKSGKCTQLYNKKSEQQFVMLNRNGVIDYVRQRSKEKSDTLRIYGTVLKPHMIVQKSGQYIISANFFIYENQALETIQQLALDNGVSLEEIKNCDLSVTYVDNKHRPVNTYRLNDTWKQSELLASWEYSENRLLSYSKFVNGNLVKNFSFSYDDNKLLKSFVFNQLTFDVKYN